MRPSVRGDQSTFHVQRGKVNVGVINANQEGFVLINGEDLWPFLMEIKGIGYSPVTVISCKNILSVRLDIPLKELSELVSFVEGFLSRKGYRLEPIE